MIEALLAVSVLLNIGLVITLAYLYFKELGITYIFQKVLDRKNKNRLKDVIPTFAYNHYNKQENSIVMLGDSISYGVNWSEFVNKKVIGRGVSGDNTQNIIDRLNQVTEINPDQVFILAGINDFSRLITEKDAEAAKVKVINNYKTILSRLKRESPNSEVFVQSILPVNRDIKFSFYKNINTKIIETNKELEILAREFNVSFVNLFDSFYADGDLIPEYTRDGLHLSIYGYLKWKEIVVPYMNFNNAS